MCIPLRMVIFNSKDFIYTVGRAIEHTDVYSDKRRRANEQNVSTDIGILAWQVNICIKCFY